MEHHEVDHHEQDEQQSLEFHIEKLDDIDELKEQFEKEDLEEKQDQESIKDQNAQAEVKKEASELKSKPKHYIPGLDGLRAIAVGGVVLFHLFPDVIKGGYLGVVLFFVISGYLMVITSEADWQRDRFSFIHFYKKRLKRIYPALIVTVVLFTAFAAVVTPKALGGIRSELLSIVFGYNNWWQIAQNASYFAKSAAASPFTHLWSLAIELQFYLIWPFLFILYKKASEVFDQKKTEYVFLGTAVISAVLMGILYKPGVDPSRIYYGTDTRIFALLIGAFVGIKHLDFQKAQFKGSAKRWMMGIFMLCCAGILYCYISMSGEMAITYRGGMFLASLLFGIIVLLTGSPGLAAGRLLDQKWLNWIGKRSYEIYLIQYPVIFFWGQIRPESENLILPIIPAILILCLAALLHSLLEGRQQKQIWAYFSQNKKQAAIAAGLVLAILVLFVYGLCSAAPDRLTDDQRKLQQELEQNAQMLEEQKANAEKAAALLEEEKGPDEDPLSQSVTIIGDSVVLGAAPALQANIPHAVIDAAEGRQVNEALGILQSLDSQELLGKTVIIGLGANGPFTPEEGQAILDYLGKDRYIYWITVCGPDISWRDSVNSTIRELDKKNKGLRIVKWDENGPSNPQWFYDDGLHLNPDGQNGFATFIVNEIRSGIEVKPDAQSDEKQNEDKEAGKESSSKEKKN